MFCFQWQREAINDTVKIEGKRSEKEKTKLSNQVMSLCEQNHIPVLPSQNLQQFTNTVEVFRFINEAQENVIDLFSYEGAKS